MLKDEMIAFEQLSGENAELTSISRIGGFLDGYQKAMEKQQWIPCSERLPDEYVSVLCYQPILYGSNIWIGHLNSDGNWVDSDGWEKLTNPVTAWMPLPEPYREETES